MKELLERMRGFEIDHEPDGWPGIQMREVSALCDEIERLQSESEMRRTGDTCARQCEGTAYRIRARQLEAENAQLKSLLHRYRTETPLGHQPHMIAHLADAALEISK